jgi:hypothetical protein
VGTLHPIGTGCKQALLVPVQTEKFRTLRDYERLLLGGARALFACCWSDDPDDLASPDQRKSRIPGIRLSEPDPIRDESFNASIGSGTMYRPLEARLKLPGRDPEARETLIGFESRFVGEM